MAADSRTETEIINVGGEKVYPAEVENVLQEVENIRRCGDRPG
jgi:acyl-CoA synthetase (AMP-forming)/AMP-acid ligase II